MTSCLTTLLRSSLPARAFSRTLLALAFALGASLAAAAGTVTGAIHNGTSGKPAAGVDVILIQLQGGMQSVANTKTDAQGNYKIDNPAVGGPAPMLIRAVYRGVMFHQPLPPGQNTADVTVYEPSSDAKTVKVGSRLVVFQPNGTALLVGEEYALQNESQPPMAYFKQQGDFDFEIPDGAQLSEVSSWGPSGMPVVQGTINRGKQHYAIAYAFQPGDNGVRFSYQVPYPDNRTVLHFTMDQTVARVMLVAPPTVQVTSQGFTAAGSEQGFNLYARDNMPAGMPFDVSLSGTAPPPSAGGQPSQAGGSAGADGSAGQDQVNGRDQGAALQTLPNRLDAMKWMLLAGFAALFALGSLLVWRRPVAVSAATAGNIEVDVPATPPRESRPRAPRTSAPIASPPATEEPPAADIAREVEKNLDGLKDKLFRLELRHQAGTISDQEYAQERARTEAILRELVRG